MSNTINVTFCGNTAVKTDALWQYDTDQILYFSDLTLTDYEVHFCNTKESGTATVVTGTADGVEIPDDLLATGKPVYAWIYQDDMTTHSLTIPVLKRPAIGE